MTIACCVSGSMEQRVRKFNATPQICINMIPPLCRYIKNRRKFFDYAVIAQLVLKRSVNLSFIGTRQKRVTGVMAQVRVNGIPAGRFEGYSNEYYIDCPPGKMNTIYFASLDRAAGVRFTWHAPVNAGRPIFVHTTFVDRTGLLWRTKRRLYDMLVPLGDSFEGGDDRSISTDEFFSALNSSDSLDLDGLLAKARAPTQ